MNYYTVRLLNKQNEVKVNVFSDYQNAKKEYDKVYYDDNTKKCEIILTHNITLHEKL